MVGTATWAPEVDSETIAEGGILEKRGCIVVAFEHDSTMKINPTPESAIPETGDIILIGTAEAEERFLRIYPPGA